MDYRLTPEQAVHEVAMQVDIDGKVRYSKSFANAVNDLDVNWNTLKLANDLENLINKAVQLKIDPWPLFRDINKINWNHETF